MPVGDYGVVSEREPGPVVTLVWALDEVFIGFAGRPVAVVRRELEDACELWDCRLDADTLDVFAAEIAAGDPGPARRTGGGGLAGRAVLTGAFSFPGRWRFGGRARTRAW